MADAFVHQINLSRGGVPKLPAKGPIAVGTLGLTGDAHNDTRHHGGPDRALCLYSVEVIEALQDEGHPIKPGFAGENLTISGLDWFALASGDELLIGENLVAQLTWPTTSCAKNAAWFAGRDYRRIDDDLYPGWSRWYARVIADGSVAEGDRVVHRSAARSAPADD